MIAAIRLAFQALFANKLRASLTMLGNIIGVTCVVALINIGNSGREKMLGNLSAISQNLVFVHPRYDAESENPRERWRPMTLDDAEELRAGVPSAAVLSPVIDFSGKASFGSQNCAARVQGVWPGYLELNDRKIASGQAFTDSDVQSASKVMVIGSKTATQLFGNLDPVSQSIRFNGQPFTIIAVMAEKGAGFGGEEQDNIIFTPVTTVTRRMTGNSYISHVAASPRVREDLEQMKKEIRSVMRVAHRLPPNKRDDIQIFDLGTLAKSFDSFLMTATALLSAIAGISLLVGGIGIMNIMLVSVTERTREIGLRMAVGATDFDVLMQFLIEAIVLSCTGGVIGVGVGLGLSTGTSVFLEWPILLSQGSVVLAMVFSAAVGIFFGLYPAWRASRLDPMVALRHE